MSYLTPFFMNDMLSLNSGNVYVVSDSQYKELQQKQAEEEISTLQNRLLAYESAANRLQARITELQTEHGLLPEASE